MTVVVVGSGFLSDVIAKKHSKTFVRKFFNTLGNVPTHNASPYASAGFVIPGICMLSVIFHFSTTFCAVSLIIATAAGGFLDAGFYPCYSDISPHHAGALISISNGIAQVRSRFFPFACADSSRFLAWSVSTLLVRLSSGQETGEWSLSSIRLFAWSALFHSVYLFMPNLCLWMRFSFFLKWKSAVCFYSTLFSWDPSRFTSK